MSLLRKLFSKQPEAGARAGGGGPAAAAASAQGSAMIRVYDEQGQEIFIPREQWRRSLLPRTLQGVRDDPDQLAFVLSDAVREGFAADILSYAEHLQRTDPQPSRGASILATAYLGLGRLEEAERVLNDFTTAQGDDPTVLAALGSVYHARGDSTRAESVWWRALELDANHWGALGSCMVTWRERGGDAGEREGLWRVTMLPGCWRARLWLARYELEERNLPAALALYQEALSQAGQPAPADLLFQMSGDLGQHGHSAEAVALAAPPFDVALHGLPTGNNLIKAHFELHQFEDARRVLHLLRARARPDWLGVLGYWEAELAKAEAARAPSPAR